MNSDSLYKLQPGSRFPAGVSKTEDGVNFCIFSRNATKVELLLYEDVDSPHPFQVIELDPSRNHSFYFWHVFVENLPTGTCYTWRIDGPNDTAGSGRRFCAKKELLDPWARAVSDLGWDRKLVSDPESSQGGMRAIVVDQPRPFVRQNTNGQNLEALEGAIIYELHVAGFTLHPSSGVQHPGAFLGLKEKIPYLKELGITHVELLPVMAFDRQDVPPNVADRGLSNYWGYSTHSFRAPHPGYCLDLKHATFEFRDMVDAFHDAGIKVILDVVFNHTSEGGKGGPVINFKGMFNEIFYHLDAIDRQNYLDFTGCGNTVNCNHPIVSSFIVQCLEYWVEEMGVDGFRFDLASVFTRGDFGVPLHNPPLPWGIEFSKTLANVPLIAEAWDAAGLYHVGSFPGMAWAEWNGRYRDVMRKFVRGDAGMISEVASRFAGSADMYKGDCRLPANSINFITCHDGFTLNDLVSYNHKHNEPNGEENRDGTNDNFSWNCGHEGETEDIALMEMRKRQAKNFIALLMLSRGVPMLLAGDEVLKSQRGNNNAYCQNNEISWFDWGLVERNQEMLRFTREMVSLRKRHPCLTVNSFFSGQNANKPGMPDITWYGADGNDPQWVDPEAGLLSCTIAGIEPEEQDLHVIMNMSNEDVEVLIPPLDEKGWELVVDTFKPSPLDIKPCVNGAVVEGTYKAQKRSVVVLESFKLTASPTSS